MPSHTWSTVPVCGQKVTGDREWRVELHSETAASTFREGNLEDCSLSLCVSFFPFCGWKIPKLGPWHFPYVISTGPVFYFANALTEGDYFVPHSCRNCSLCVSLHWTDKVSAWLETSAKFFVRVLSTHHCWLLPLWLWMHWQHFLHLNEFFKPFVNFLHIIK